MDSPATAIDAALGNLLDLSDHVAEKVDSERARREAAETAGETLRVPSDVASDEGGTNG